jgi:AcrR family transcriptional regulator
MLPELPPSPRKHPKQERSQFTVEAILTAAAHILTEDGYAQFNTNRVAKRAGVSIGSLYQYFPNKEALIAALVAQRKDQMLALAQQHLERLEEGSVAVVLSQMIKAAIAANAVNPGLHRVLYEQLPRRLAMIDGAQIEPMLRAFLESRRDQVKPQDLDLAVFMVRCTIEALIERAMLDRPELLSDGALEQEITTLLSGYLVKPGV